MNADGSGQTRLTHTPVSEGKPAWSPDGTRLAFVRIDDAANGGDREIWTMHADGTHQTRLTANAAEDDHPSWAPDGSRIAFDSDRDSYGQVYVMNADGSGPRNLSGLQFLDERSPDWSATGEIAFRTGYGQIGRMDANGGSVKAVTEPSTGYLFGWPAWSPSGRVLAYQLDNAQAHQPWIVIHDVASGGTGSLVPPGIAFTQPAWSPDGRHLALAGQAGTFDIWSVDANGSAVNLTNTAAKESQPDWQRPPTITCPKPAIKGKRVVGKRLRVVQGSLSPALSTVSYQWFRKAKAIKGATGVKYKIRRKDRGKKVSVRATCTVVGATGPVAVASAKKKVRR
ncbi:hypothetical protein FHP29_18420 [Nocardioides albidus]|uniref:Uncharacterized protein n=1 Tax=Nocardioides albidus TaxID=1517589 RepID=A0A5C4VKE8_9ACTN|nr:hypothetical protein FHP29_18420 [Nocardioides albidus]